MSARSRRNANGPQLAKQDLPSKICAACLRPFTWRRKWAKDWPSVRYCSERCRRRGATNTELP